MTNWIRVINFSSLIIRQVLIIDLDKNMMVKSFGDELTIIPRKLRKALTQALKEDVPGEKGDS